MLCLVNVDVLAVWYRWQALICVYVYFVVIVFTDPISTGCNVITSVRPFISTLTFELSDLQPCSFACVGDYHGLQGIKN